ncbi:MAG: peptidoglycan bridge formation glycyltransferase FemA/FemB family protein, partial [Spirochaetaceae bacterium]|nr:peptidoglycan bridge formation glycyltransferase FemA/FemB family protein [Spirochaetaceae bacterium]
DGSAVPGAAPGAGAAPERPAVGAPLRRAAADVQPPDTVLLDLRPSEAELLAGMKPKWRYNVRLAEKKGVAVEECRGAAALAALPEFYRLYEATSERDRIALHPEAYYARLFSLASERAADGDEPRPDLRLWIARHQGQALAAIVTLFRGGEAVYLYGASSNEKRNLMPAYALQWAAIKAAKASGCGVYDFYGIPPLDDPEHPMAGLYRFKTGFGGEIAHRAGSWDYALKPAVYAAFRAAEGLRRWWFKDFRKRFGKRGE